MSASVALGKTIKVLSVIGLTSTPTRSQAEGGSQTFKRGAPLVTSGGYLVEAASPVDPNDVIEGVAQAPGHNSSAGTDTASYVPAHPGVEFVGVLSDDTAGTHTLAQADLETAYGLVKDSSSGAYFINYANTATPVVFVKAAVDAIGTVDGRVRFVFIDSSTVAGL